jgi:hypothetical protein
MAFHNQSGCERGTNRNQGIINNTGAGVGPAPFLYWRGAMVNPIRDSYVMCLALAYAIEAIERLPIRWQEWSDKEDMICLLNDMTAKGLPAAFFREEARHHLDGGAKVVQLPPVKERGT